MGLRGDDALIARLDALAEELTRRAKGAKISRTAAGQAALERGVTALEAECGLSAGEKKPPKRAK